jgi:hypothetical protein
MRNRRTTGFLRVRYHNDEFACDVWDRGPAIPVREEALITWVDEDERIPIPGEEGAPPPWTSEEPPSSDS